MSEEKIPQVTVFTVRAPGAPTGQFNRAEVEARAHEGRTEAGDWLLAIDPETLAARIVHRDARGFVADVQGHEDLFPVGMALENDAGFLPGGDWLVAFTPEHRPHDGIYRSYRIEWE